MKVYFGFTVAGDRSTVETARQVVRLLEELGHEVLTRHLVDDDARERDRQLGAEQIYARDMAWLEACDAFIAEVSGSSFGIGYEAAYVLAGSARPVVLLYQEAARPRISLLISGNTHPRCERLAYTDFAQIEALLRGRFPRD